MLFYVTCSDDLKDGVVGWLTMYTLQLGSLAFFFISLNQCYKEDRLHHHCVTQVSFLQALDMISSTFFKRQKIYTLTYISILNLLIVTLPPSSLNITLSQNKLNCIIDDILKCIVMITMARNHQKLNFFLNFEM